MIYFPPSRSRSKQCSLAAVFGSEATLKRNILIQLAAGPQTGEELSKRLKCDNNGHFTEQLNAREMKRLHIRSDMSVRPVLVHLGNLDGSVEGDGFFDAIIPAQALLNLRPQAPISSNQFPLRHSSL